MRGAWPKLNQMRVMKLKFVDRYGTRFVRPTKSSAIGRALLQRYSVDRVAFVFQTQTYTSRNLPRKGEIVHLFQAWTRLPHRAEIERAHYLPMRTARSTVMGYVIFKSHPSLCPQPVR